MLQILIPLIEEVLLGATLPIVAGRDKKWKVVFHVSQRVENFNELLSSVLLLLLLPRLGEVAILVAHQRSAWPSTVVSVDADPLGFELSLNKLKAIERAHVLSWPRCSWLSCRIGAWGTFHLIPTLL